jgi:CPA2 family monovalent cation:H+ antiporter-2
VIAGLTVAATGRSEVASLATAYVLFTVIVGPLAARFVEPVALRVSQRRSASSAVPPPATPPASPRA